MKKYFKKSISVIAVVAILAGLIVPLVTYSPVLADGEVIAIGSEATDRATTLSSGLTLIDLSGTCNGTGVINEVKIYANSTYNLVACEVATAYLVSGTTYKIRDNEEIGAVTAGSVQTFSELSLDAQAGDFLAIYFTSGKVECDTSGGSGIRWLDEEHIDTGDEADYTNVVADGIMSVSGTGTASGGGSLTLTTGTTGSVEETTANATGNITATAGSNATAVFFQYDTDTGEPYSYNVTVEGDYGTGQFYVPLTGLTPGELYYGRAGATDGTNTSYGSETTFLTKPNPATSFTVTTTGKQTVSLSWTNGTGCDYNELRYSYIETPSANTSGAMGYWGNGTSTTLTGVSSNSTIYFRLFTHATEGGVWKSADGTVSANTTTLERTYPTYVAADTYQGVFIGDSIFMDVHTEATIGEYTANLTGYSIYDAGGSGERTDEIAARWAADVTANAPNFVVIEGGVNDIYQDSDYATFINSWGTMLNAAESDSNIELVIVTLIMPWENGTNEQMQTRDTWNAALRTLAESENYTKTVVIDVSPWVGEYRATGDTNNLWDILDVYDHDGVHFNDVGNAELAIAYSTGFPLDSAPSAPTGFSATDGTNFSSVNLTWTDNSDNESGFYLWRDDGLIASLDPNTTHYEDTGAYAAVIVPGVFSASDGTSTSNVSLSIASSTITTAATHTYKLSAYNESGQSSNVTDTGYRGHGSLSYTYQVSLADSDANYSNIDVATSATSYNYTLAPAPTITVGTGAASDGTSTSYVQLVMSGQTANNGAGRYYRALLNADGCTQATATANRGYRGVGTLTYQWQRSSADADADYSNIAGGTTATYNDTAAPEDGSGRYYKCVLAATGATGQTTTADRGYRATASSSTTSTATPFAPLMPLIGLVIGIIVLFKTWDSLTGIEGVVIAGMILLIVLYLLATIDTSF